MRALTTHDTRFAVRLRRVREIRELDQQTIADAAAIDRSAVSNIERCQRAVTIGEAMAICAALDVPIGLMLSSDPLSLTIAVPVDGAV